MKTSLTMTNGATHSITVGIATHEEVDHWDALVERFPGCRVVHRRAWMESLEASMPGTALYLVCRRDGEVVGCWPGMLRRVGMLGCFGSPLPGSQTISMGPVFDPQRVSAGQFVAAAVEHLQGRHRVGYVELISRSLPGNEMRALGFEGASSMTHRVPLLPGREEDVLKGFKENARRNVRRAARLGLEARFEDDESFVDEAYEQIQQGCVRRGDTVSFSKQRVLAFFRHMKAAGKLAAVSVHLPNGGPSIATGLFTISDNELLLWQWAHRTEHRWYRPTEFMTWTAMRRAMQAGCDVFDLMGGHDFKKGFGAGEDYAAHRWTRSRYKSVARLRRWAEKCYRWQQEWRGQVAAGLKKRQ